MISRLNRYISIQLAAAIIIIAFSLTAIVWLTQALRFIDYIVNKGVSTITFLQMTGLMIPSLLFTILPFAMFVSILFIYHRLNTDSELIVLRSAGQSRWQLSKPIIIVAGTATIFAYIISLSLMPAANAKFRDMQTFLRDNYASLLLQEEVFNTPMKGLTVFVRKRHANGSLEGILVHDSRNSDQPVTMMAQNGRIEKTDTGPRFLLYNGNRQGIQSGRFSFLKFEEYAVDLNFYTEETTLRKRKPNELTIGQLLIKAKEFPEERAKFLAETHHRITWPLFVIILGLLAFSAIMRGEFNRRGIAKRLTIATISAIIIIAITLGIRSIINKHIGATPLLYLNLSLWLWFVLWQLREPNQKEIPEFNEEIATK